MDFFSLFLFFLVFFILLDGCIFALKIVEGFVWRGEGGKRLQAYIS